MASIRCPSCGTELHHFSIDVVAGGGGLGGSGGITCPSCQKQIPNFEIERLVRYGALYEHERPGAGGPSWFERVGDRLGGRRWEKEYKAAQRERDKKEKTAQKVEVALRRLADAGDFDAVIEALEGEDPAMRERGMQIIDDRLQKLADAGDIESVAGALRRNAPPVRERAIKILAETRDPRAAGLILDALGEAIPSGERRVADKATSALESIGAADPEPLIVGLSHPTAEVRWTVAQLLGKLGSTNAMPALTDALDDPDEWVREAASAALERIESR